MVFFYKKEPFSLICESEVNENHSLFATKISLTSSISLENKEKSNENDRFAWKL